MIKVVILDLFHSGNSMEQCYSRQVCSPMSVNELFVTGPQQGNKTSTEIKKEHLEMFTAAQH